MSETFSGWVATGSGESKVVLRLDEEASVTLTSDWMGQEPFAIELAGRHRTIGSHYGVIFVERASREKENLPLPPSDGTIVLEYLRVPPQPNENVASDMVEMSSDPFSVVIWLHPNSYFDDGTDLDADEYEVPPEKWRPVVEALKLLDHPWKLSSD